MPQSPFTRSLLRWYCSNARKLPWTGIRNPYWIWLSEIILQQTRVDQGMAYYLRFIQKYPTVNDLAAADYDEVMKLWEGLGYYSRARNMMATAQKVSRELHGVFPDTPDALQKLPGIGPYTARAIAAFAFQYPTAVVDGNVVRILSRVFGIRELVQTPGGRKIFQEKADALLNNAPPSDFNQALMDFGSLVCKPTVPLCTECPLSASCYAFQHQLVSELPLKFKKPEKQKRYFQYLVLVYQDQILVSRRSDKDIWQGLFDFPHVEAPVADQTASFIYHLPQRFQGLGSLQPTTYGPYRQTLTHRLVEARFWVYTLTELPAWAKARESEMWVSLIGIEKVAFPKVIRKFLSNLN